ncbi:hypothetical protein F6P95_08280 [Escherichia coli]|nr:hypothetical protein F6P95_08280 [Escherichia coli]
MSRIILFTSGTYADFITIIERYYEFYLCRNDNEPGISISSNNNHCANANLINNYLNIILSICT